MLFQRLNGRSGGRLINGRNHQYSGRAGMYGGIGGGAGAATGPAFSATLLSSLIPEVYTGSSTPTFTRATTAYVTDFEGLLKQVPSGASRHTGARFVRNYVVTNSEDITNAAYAASTATRTSANVATGSGANSYIYQGGILPAGDWCLRVQLTRITGSGPIRLSCDGGGTYVDVSSALTASPQVFSKLQTGLAAGAANFVIRIDTNGDQIGINKIQFENVVGQTNQNPSEYISVGVLSAPYHGAGVDGVKYFTTQNGNTVASNVVTEATGAAISSATLLGYQVEGARTNLVLQSQTAGTTWTATNVTVAADSIAAPDGTTTADTLTASAGNGTWLQGVTVASAAKTFSIWLKRKTGTGNIDLTLDNGATWTTKAITSSWAKYEITQTLANPTVGVRIVTNADAVYVWGAQLEDGVSFSSSYIPTTTVSVTRNADLLSYSVASNFGDTAGSVYAEAMFSAVNAFSLNSIVTSAGAAAVPLYASSATAGGVNDGATATTSAGTSTSFLTALRKVAAAWGGATKSVSKDGAAAASGTFDGSMNSGASFAISDSTYTLWGNVRNLSIWTTKKTDAELAALTT